jgi:hypothetical protein
MGEGYAHPGRGPYRPALQKVRQSSRPWRSSRRGEAPAHATSPRARRARSFSPLSRSPLPGPRRYRKWGRRVDRGGAPDGAKPRRT